MATWAEGQSVSREKGGLNRVEPNTIYNMDCLEGMKLMADASVDVILCDLPYGTTHNKWDSVIPLPDLWTAYERILKPTGVAVLTSCQPFTTALISSKLPWFQYSLVWEKNVATGHLDARRRPLRKHEDILVFSPQSYQSKSAVYNPQMTEGKPYTRKFRAKNGQDNGSNYGAWKRTRTDIVNDGQRYPVSIIQFDCEKGLHPTQKPVPLFEYLVRTYTNPGELVLDNCMGSGTTAIACINADRRYIGFETDAEYFNAAQDRIERHRPPSASPVKATASLNSLFEEEGDAA